MVCNGNLDVGSLEGEDPFQRKKLSNPSGIAVLRASERTCPSFSSPTSFQVAVKVVEGTSGSGDIAAPYPPTETESTIVGSENSSSTALSTIMRSKIGATALLRPEDNLDIRGKDP